MEQEQKHATIETFSRFKLDIAVTGEPKAGKSSLVNALLGLDGENRAPCGVGKTTLSPTMYESENLPKARLWDLPGIGSLTQKAKGYTKRMKFDCYDMFIIVMSEDAIGNCLKLISDIQKRGKPFCFVKSKVDHESLEEEREEEERLTKIRNDCIIDLPDKMCDSHIFLVSSHYTEQYDLRHLIRTLRKEEFRWKGFDQLLQTLSSRSYTPWLLKFFTPPVIKRKKVSKKDVKLIRTTFQRSGLADETKRQAILAQLTSL